MKFTIDSNSTYYDSVLWYISTIDNNCDEYKYICTETLNKTCEKLKEKIHFLCNKNNFQFQLNNDIEASILIHSPEHCIPMPVNCGGIKILSELIITIDIEKQNITNTQAFEIINDFLIETKKKFKEISKFKSSDGNILVYALDGGWWDTIQEINPRELNSIILDEDVEKKIKRVLDNYTNPVKKDKFKELGIRNKLNIVLEGLPGTGKSSLCTAIATSLKKNIATIDFNQDDLSDVKFIRSLRKFPENSICLLEDFDALFINREKTDNSKVSFSCLLNFLDGSFTQEDSVTVITTNHIQKIDKAILRPMRTDNIFTFGFCSKYQCKKMFEKLFPGTTIFPEIYKLIKNKKFTTCIYQKWLINCLEEPEKLGESINILDELIDLCLDKKVEMYT